MKKNFFLYFSYAALSGSFIAFAFLVKWTPKNQKLIARKIKLGAALVALTSVFNSCSGPDPGVVTCYEVAEPDSSKAEIKNGTLTNDSVSATADTIGIKSSLNRVTCYGPPVNRNNTENE